MGTVHIIGGGFSGLTLAYFLQKKNVPVVVYEKDHWGGCLQTLSHRSSVIETAASGFLNSPLFEEMNQVMGAEVRGVEGSPGRYIYSRGQPRRWPLTFTESLPLVSFILRLIWQKWVRRIKVPRGKESIGAWGRRCLSPAIVEKLLEPALRGIYAGEVERLSASLILGPILVRFSSKGRFGSKKQKLRRRGLMTGRQGGMEGWIRDLTRYLQNQGVTLRQEEIRDLNEWRQREWSEGDRIVLAVPPPSAARLLRSVGDKRSDILDQIEMIPLASVTLLLEGESRLKGFGCLFPQRESFQSLGVLFRQSFFPEPGGESQERWLVKLDSCQSGDSGRMAEAQNQERLLLDRIDQDRRRLWGEEAPSIVTHHVKIWPQALPHYTVDLEAHIQALEGATAARRAVEGDRLPVGAMANKESASAAAMASEVVLHGNYLGALGLTALLERSSQLAEKLVFEKQNP